jgi:hypothetical protein
VRKVAQQVVVLCNAAHQLLVFRHEAAEARALLRLGRNAEVAEDVTHRRDVGLGLEKVPTEAGP